MGEINVSFQIDTDNRENFSSSAAFYAFKRQRDSFYEILRIWEENHSVSGWLFSKALRTRIQSLLTLYSDATNYCHFARLFKSQLLITCIYNNEEEINDDESLNVLKTLKHVNPEKLTQLKKRLVTPLPPSKDSLVPTFPGMQEFFRDFIIHAFNPIFYVHLENCLINEIMELNDMQFSNNELGESELLIDEQTKQKFVSCVLSLRLLAKFAGFLNDLPYYSESDVSREIMATHVNIRSKVLPPLNLQKCLQNAIYYKKLSLTIPWVVKYLAMMNGVTLHLPYFLHVLEFLYYVHWMINNYDSKKLDALMSQRSATLVKYCLNWLFELPNFPKEVYLSWEQTIRNKEMKHETLFDKNSFLRQTLLNIGNSSSNDDSEMKFNLDKADIINDRLIKMCCPLLSELKVSVSKRSDKINRNNMNKHITLVSSPLHNKPQLVNKGKSLQLQLEAAFFHGQPASTQKTTEFIGERVASACVKNICNTLLVTSREAVLVEFRKRIKEQQQKVDPENRRNFTAECYSDFKQVLEIDIKNLASNSSKKFKEECDKVVPNNCKVRVTNSIQSLLADDSIPYVANVCINIATRMAIERVNLWIQSHVAGGSLFVKDMEIEINRFLKNTTPVHVVKDKQHDFSVPSPTDIINSLRSAVWDLIENEGKNLKLESLIDMLEKINQTITKRADLLPYPSKTIYQLTVDFAIFLVSYRSDLFKEEIQDKLTSIWVTDTFDQLKMDSPINRLLCPRNIAILMKTNNQIIWTVYGNFAMKLLNKNIINLDIFSDQCVALFRQEWPIPVLKNLSKCLSESIENLEVGEESAEKFKFLLGWIARTYREMEFCDYGSGVLED